MFRHSIATILALSLCACASSRPDLADWVRFVDSAESYGPAGLEAHIEATRDQYRAAPDDLTRLRLAFLLSCRDEGAADLDASHALLAEVSGQSTYAPMRDMVERHIELVAEIRTMQQEIDRRAARIRELDDRIESLEAQESEVRALRARVLELHAQIDALKSIETDISEGQKKIDELSR